MGIGEREHGVRCRTVQGTEPAWRRYERRIQRRGQRIVVVGLQPAKLNEFGKQ